MRDRVSPAPEGRGRASVSKVSAVAMRARALKRTPRATLSKIGGIAGAVAVLVVAASIIAGQRLTPVVVAVGGTCGMAYWQDCGEDTTQTSALDVTHLYYDGLGQLPVEPDDAEKWTITPIYETPDDPVTIPGICRCNELAASSVTAEVTWTGTAWSVECTGCNPLAGPVYEVSACAQGGKNCLAEDTHSYGYKLVVDLADQWSWYQCVMGTYPRYLERVQYAASSVDDGYVLDVEECTLGSGVEWSPDVDGATDEGSFECSYSCDADGASVILEYE